MINKLNFKMEGQHTIPIYEIKGFQPHYYYNIEKMKEVTSGDISSLPIIIDNGSFSLRAVLLI